MIPKAIHYCWFGGKSLPKLAKKCIASWKKHFPDYEIKEWNERNFDVNVIPYTEKSYKAGKYAFVSDYARYWILYHHGGIYFDTDVEVIQSFKEIVDKGPFLGIEKNRDSISINPGLGMGTIPKIEFYKKMLELYENWIPSKDEEIPEPLLIKCTTDLMRSSGFQKRNSIQKINDITIYPNEYFNPLDDYTGKLSITRNTHSIHHYAKSWVENYGPLRNWLSKKYHIILNLIKTANGS